MSAAPEGAEQLLFGQVCADRSEGVRRAMGVHSVEDPASEVRNGAEGLVVFAAKAVECESLSARQGVHLGDVQSEAALRRQPGQHRGAAGESAGADERQEADAPQADKPADFDGGGQRAGSGGREVAGPGASERALHRADGLREESAVGRNLEVNQEDRQGRERLRHDRGTGRDIQRVVPSRTRRQDLEPLLPPVLLRPEQEPHQLQENQSPNQRTTAQGRQRRALQKTIAQTADLSELLTAKAATPINQTTKGGIGER